MTSPASCVCEPQRIVGGCAICNGASVVSDARLDELIRLTAIDVEIFTEQRKHGRAAFSLEVSQALEELRQLRALAQTQRLGPMEG